MRFLSVIPFVIFGVLAIVAFLVFADTAERTKKLQNGEEVEVKEEIKAVDSFEMKTEKKFFLIFPYDRKYITVIFSDGSSKVIRDPESIQIKKAAINQLTHTQEIFIKSDEIKRDNMLLQLDSAMFKEYNKKFTDAFNIEPNILAN